MGGVAYRGGLAGVEALECLTDGIAAVNEDLIGQGHCSLWVLDGATGLAREPLLPGRSIARWFVEAVDKHLIETEDPEDIPNWIQCALCRVRDDFSSLVPKPPADHYEFPSAGLALLTVRDSEVSFSVLGDCRILVQRLDGRIDTLLGSPRIEALDEEVVSSMVEVQRTGVLDYREVRRRVLPLLRRNRALMNRPDGYWVLGLEPEAARHLTTQSLPKQEVNRALLVSDGFYRLVDTFQRFSDRELVEAAASLGLKELFSNLRCLEARDPNCLHYPRLKPSDDASAILVQVS